MITLNARRQDHHSGAANRMSTSMNRIDKKSTNKRKKNRSKGTISGYADSVNGLSSGIGVYDSCTGSPYQHPLRDGSIGSGSSVSRSGSDVSGVAVASSASYSAKLGLACVKGALGQGFRTKLALCPVRMRNRLLQEEAQKASEEQRSRQLRDYQMEHGVAEEELSSGDEEEEDLENEMQSIPAASSIGSGTGMGGGSTGLSSSRHSDASVGAGSANNSSANLAFGQRKIRFFDVVTAKERKTARQYLLKELRCMKKRDNEPLEEYLKRMQQRDKTSTGTIIMTSQLRHDDLGLNATDSSSANATSRLCNPASTSSVDVDLDMHGLPINETVGMPAALILESLALTPLESIEGMSKCYDGLVAAGTALLDDGEKNLLDSTTSVSTKTTASDSRPSRTKVKTALLPLLITSLSQISGEVLLALARLRSLCGTWRYRRRFVQRIAPVLVRPPYAAIWCLKHQNDMGAIVAATELLLDEAQELFSYGWHERGIQLRNDGRRAEFLNAAARQLRNLSTSASSLRHRGLLTQPSRDTMIPESSLAEWEVLAVDHQIQMSIGNIFTRDWSRTLLTPPNPPRKNSDGDSNRIRTNSTGSNISCPKSPRALKIHLGNTQPPSNNFAPPISVDDSPTRSPTCLDMPNLGKLPIYNSINQPTPQTPKGLALGNANVGPPPRSPSSPPRTINSPKPNANQAVSSPAPPLSPSPSIDFTSSTTPRSTTASNIHPRSRNTLLTPEERKRYVQACRALRAQITRFEEAFIQIHGKPPKSAAERSPLATTYAQYREWKRAIRSDAACRIQASIRAYQCIQIIETTRNKHTVNFLQKIRKKYRNKNVIPIPMDIQPSPQQQQQPQVIPVMTTPSHQPKQPQLIRPPPEIPTPPSNTAPSQKNEPNIPISEIPQHKLNEIKRELKNILKKYDMEFYKSRGRMPTKQEKEPIRTLYERYNTIKREISTREQNQKVNIMGSASTSGSVNSTSSVNSSVSSTGYSISSNSHSFTTPQQILHQHQHQQQHYIEQNSSEDESISNMPLRKNKHNKTPTTSSPNGRGSPTSLPDSISDSATPSTAPSTLSPNTNTSSQQQIFIGGDLDALKREKNELHALLRNFERQFYDQHRRQVESFADIRPVANQYRRYKEIKRQISALTSSSSSSSNK